MGTNKLKERIKKIIGDNAPADEVSATDMVYSLIADVSVSFVKWYNFNDYKKLAALLGKPSFDYNDLLGYFIQNIYNQ